MAHSSKSSNHHSLGACWSLARFEFSIFVCASRQSRISPWSRLEQLVHERLALPSDFMSARRDDGIRRRCQPCKGELGVAAAKKGSAETAPRNVAPRSC